MIETGAEAATGTPSARRPWFREPVLVTAVLMIVAALGVRLPILTASYFVEDDFLFVGDAYEHSLTFDFLFRVHKGHLMPGALALTWGLSRISAYNWVLVSAVTFAAQTAVFAMLLRLLTRLFGVRAGILLPLALFLFSPLTIPAFGWWSAAINAIPLQLAMVLALDAQVRYVRLGRGAFLPFLWVLFGMAFSTKGVFLPFLLFAVTTAFLRGREGSWLRSILRELRDHRAMWGSYGVLLGGYTVLYLARMSTAPGEGAAKPTAREFADLVQRLLGQTFPAGAVGGPVSWGPVLPTGGMADPGTLVVIAGWAVLALLVAATLLWRRHALRAWLIVAGYIAGADAIPTAIARGTGIAEIVGSETRYLADGVLVLVICLALALMPVRGEADPYRRAVPSGTVLVAGLAAGAYVAVSLISIENYRQTLSGDRVRDYVATARAALAKAPEDAVIFSTPLPEDIVLPWNGNRRLSHHLLAPLARPALRARMRAPEQSEHALVFDGKGGLVPASVQATFGALPPAGKPCLPTLMGATLFDGVVSFGGVGPVGGLAYAAQRPVTATVEMSGQRTQLNLRATTGSLLQFPVPMAGKGLLLRLDDPSAKVCFRGFAFGDPVPAK